jgi:hypothetical protein
MQVLEFLQILQSWIKSLQSLHIVTEWSIESVIVYYYIQLSHNESLQLTQFGISLHITHCVFYSDCNKPYSFYDTQALHIVELLHCLQKVKTSIQSKHIVTNPLWELVR